MTIIVDEEFRSLIPPLTHDELEQLEANLLKDGCREPLIIWKEQGILLDGHNRKALCEKNSIPFSTSTISFPERNEALAWIIRNQFGRRNLSNFQRAELALRLEPLIAAKAKAAQVRKSENSVPQISAEQKPIETRKEIAKEAGVSHDTIDKVKRINASPVKELSRFVREGKITVNAASHVAKLPIEKQIQIVESGPETIKKIAVAVSQKKGKPISIGPVTYKKLLSIIKDINAMCQKPSHQISTVELRSKAASLLETFSKIADKTYSEDTTCSEK